MAVFGLVGLGSRSWNVYTMIGKGGFEKGTYRTEWRSAIHWNA